MRKIFILLLLTTITLLSQAQIKDPANWSFSNKKGTDGEYELTMRAILPPGWTIYSMYTPDGGPLPTSLDFEQENKGIRLMGKATENKPQVKFDDIFEVDVWYFAGEYIITQKIKLTDPTITSVKGTLEYQVCQKGQCILFDHDFEIKLNKSPNGK